MNAYINQNRPINGQLTVPGLLMIFLTLMVFKILTPTILTAVTAIEGNLTTALYFEEAALVKLIPLFLLVVLLSSIALYAAPQP